MAALLRCGTGAFPGPLARNRNFRFPDGNTLQRRKNWRQGPKVAAVVATVGSVAVGGGAGMEGSAGVGDAGKAGVDGCSCHG